jgi:hypothetical protein
MKVATYTITILNLSIYLLLYILALNETYDQNQRIMISGFMIFLVYVHLTLIPNIALVNIYIFRRNLLNHY